MNSIKLAEAFRKVDEALSLGEQYLLLPDPRITKAHAALREIAEAYPGDDYEEYYGVRRAILATLEKEGE